jgi:fatty-acyl-CoA synthase
MPQRSQDAGPADPLTPLQFLVRAATYFGGRIAVVDGRIVVTYGELHQRCQRLAGALRERGVGDGDRVAVLAPNSLALLEAHYGVALAGGVLVALNTRLNPGEIATILDHSDPSLLIWDERLAPLAEAATSQSSSQPTTLRAGGGRDQYEAALREATPFNRPCANEQSLLAINYTSGTTGKPKGVMYSHRGAYLQALAMAFHMRLDLNSVFLWTLPMFHCNGWCFTWAVTAAGGRHVCLERPDPRETWRLVRTQGVTHFNCAPTVLNDLINSDFVTRDGATTQVHVAVGGAPPSPTLLARSAQLGIEVTHLYGLTETYGPAVICEMQPEWGALAADDRAVLKARQGTANVVTESLRIVDKNGHDVAADGRTVGEIAIRGNNVMLGYYADDEATRQALPDGWLRTGDLGVRHSDGYVELTDRAKDVIISGGENIASVEVERVLAAHPDILEAAVVATPDLRWGEVPAAFITLRDGASVSESRIVDFVRERLAHFKAPKHVHFGPLPKTSTGKVQKNTLRTLARELWPAAHDAMATLPPTAAVAEGAPGARLGPARDD